MIRKLSRRLPALIVPSLAVLALAGAAAAAPAPIDKKAPPKTPVVAAEAPQVDPARYSGLHWRGIGPYRGGRAVAVTGGHRRAGPVLFRRRGRRGVEVDRFGAHLEADLRSGFQVLHRPAGRRGGALQPRCDLCGLRRRRAARQHHLGRRSLSVERRRQDLEQRRAERHPPDRRPGGGSLDQSGRGAGGRHRSRLPGPNAERGVFRTTDGGKTWTKTLFRNDSDRRHRRRLGSVQSEDRLRRPGWQVQAPAVELLQRARLPGSGLFRSSDGKARPGPS